MSAFMSDIVSIAGRTLESEDQELKKYLEVEGSWEEYCGFSWRDTINTHFGEQ